MEPPSDATRPSGRSDADGGGNEARLARVIHYCDLCGHPMVDVHCKLVCERCGYQRDCSDP